MPIISVQLLRGRSPQMRRALIRELTEGAVRALGVAPQSVRVVLSEVEPEHWSVGDQTKAEADEGKPV